MHNTFLRNTEGENDSLKERKSKQIEEDKRHKIGQVRNETNEMCKVVTPRQIESEREILRQTTVVGISTKQNNRKKPKDLTKIGGG